MVQDTVLFGEYFMYFQKEIAELLEIAQMLEYIACGSPECNPQHP